MPVGAGAGILAQQQVQVGAGADLVRTAVQPGGLQFPGPGGDPVVDRQDLVRGQLAARQRGVTGVLGPPLHPGELRRGLAPLPRLVRSNFHDGAGDGGAQAAGGQPPGPVQHLVLGRGASSGSIRAVAFAMIRALPRLTVPSASAAAVPGRWVARWPAMPISSSARNRDSPSAFAISSAVNSASSGSGFRRSSSATTASLRAAAWASTRSHAHSIPISSPSEMASNRPSATAASAATASCAQPGSTSKTIPGPNAAAGLHDSPGNTRAEPG